MISGGNATGRGFPRFTVLAFAVAGSLGPGAVAADPTPVHVLLAASLKPAMDDLQALHGRSHPGVELHLESGGSNALARKIADLGGDADLFLPIDPRTITNILGDKAPWVVRFASNEVVIAYTPESPGAAGITPQNWPGVLLGKGVRVGRGNPDTAPMGYQTLICWKLAERYLDRPGLHDQLVAATPRPMQRDDVNQLLPPLEAGDTDYAFVYRSVAADRKMRFLPLPPEVNLGDERFAAQYAEVQVEVAGKKPGERVTLAGSPTVYAATIPATARQPAAAAGVLATLLSDEGRRILEAHGLTPFPRARAAAGPALPGPLADLVERDPEAAAK